MINRRIYNFFSALVVPLLIFFLLAAVAGCTRHALPDGDGAQKNRQVEGQIEGESSELDWDEVSFETLLPSLSSNEYYRLQCVFDLPDGVSSKDFILTTNEVQKKSFSGTLYDITDPARATVAPMPLSGVVKARKLVVTLDGKEMTLKKVVLTETKTGLSGSFTLQKRKCEFSLVRCQQPDYKIFENRYRTASHSCRIYKNVKYGEAMGYWTSNATEGLSYLEIFAKGVSSSMKKKKLNLLMDVYVPENDTLSARPLIVFLHGGAFYIGDKTDNPIVLWCKHFASCGYVTAAVNYRMGFQLTKQAIERCGYGAVQDAHAAVRFLLSKKEEYGIDPDCVFVAGSSAGAITSLNLAFMRNDTRPESSRQHGTFSDLGDIESSGNTLKQDFHIRAVANMWGAVNDLNMLSSSQTAIISFHGDADRLVPYDEGIPFSDMKVKVGNLFFGKMYGSASIHRKAQQLGYRTEFHTFKGAGHAPHVDKDNQPTQEFYFIQSHIRDFFFREFVPQTAGIGRVPGEPQWFRVDGGGLEKVFWKADGGFVLQTEGNRVRVVFVEGRPHRLQASTLWKNDASEVFSIDL